MSTAPRAGDHYLESSAPRYALALGAALTDATATGRPHAGADDGVQSLAELRDRVVEHLVARAEDRHDTGYAVARMQQPSEPQHQRCSETPF